MSDTSRPWPALPLAHAHALLTQPGSPFEMDEVDVRGERTRVWKFAPPTLREVFLAGRIHGDRVFLVDENDRVTFEAFARATLVLANELVARGVRKGDRVAIVMRNLPEFPVAFFAAALVGAIATPLNAWWTGPELQYALTDSGAKLALVDAERLTRLFPLLAECPHLERLYVCRGTSVPEDARILSLEAVIGVPRTWHELPTQALPAVELFPDDDATIFYTSGTTGRPRGALGTHRNSTFNIMALSFSEARAFVRRGEAPPQPDPTAPQKSTLIAIPLFHVTGCQAILYCALFFGAKLIMMRRWDAEAAMALIERERCNGVSGVPTIAWQLLEHPARARYDLSSLEGISYGGAPASPELVRRLKQAFPRLQLGSGWGMTETSAVCTHHASQDYEHRPDSCGPPVPVCELKIVGADGTTQPVGHIGELWAKGPNIVKEYWHDPGATADTFREGWLKTGDVARLDAEGFCYILDRAKDMLIRGGENIYCVEVENVLYEHPAVMDAALVPIPHRTLGEEPGAIVTLKAHASASEQELQDFVAQRLAAFKVPARILFWREPLPRNPNGKIVKSELKKLFA
jgi:long-chain acyl-CoA synthetase